MRHFKFPTNPHRTRKLYKRSNIDIESGLTVLIGCNGSGKTTLLNMIKSDLTKNKIPVIYFNNLSYEVQNSADRALINNDMELLNALVSSSEGERICINLNEFTKKIIYFIDTNGKLPKSKLAELFESIHGPNTDNSTEEVKHNEYWILFDAADSGMSIDNVLDLKKNVFTPILNKAKEDQIDLYIVVSANEYEMCDNEQCFNVQNGSYVTINSYNHFRNLILLSRQYKNRQMK